MCIYFFSYLSYNLNDKLYLNENNINSAVTTKKDSTDKKLSKNIEKIIIQYWDNYHANSFVFNILSTNTEPKITYRGETLFTEKKTLKDSVTSKRLINYINQFYIDKKERIIINRSKSDHLESSDYSKIRVIGYRANNEVFDVKTPIGESEYYVEYNPKFVKFYQLLDSLVKK